MTPSSFGVRSTPISGTVLTSRLKGYAEALNLVGNNQDAIDKYLNLIPGNPAFYAKGTVEVENGQIVNTDITDFKIGNLTVTKQVQDNLQSIINQAYTEMAAYPGFEMTTLQFSNGEVQFVGALPDSARVIAK